MKRTFAAFALLCLGTAAQAQEWTGFYAGGSLGYDSIEINDLSYGDGPVDMTGLGLGLFAGYNYQSGNLVFSGEFLANSHSADGNDGDYLLPASAESSLQIRGRIGYVSGNMLPYLAIGATRTKIEADHEGDGLSDDIADDTASGTSIALGLDWALNEGSFVRFEIENTNYSDDVLPFYDGSDPHDYTLDGSRISIGYAFRF